MTNSKTRFEMDKGDTADSATRLAVERTIMAADRSLMAWVRTGLSLISFGFTIYKFLEYADDISGRPPDPILSPKAVGLYLIGMGILSLIFGTLENIVTVRKLKGAYAIDRPRYSLLMAGLVALFGIVLFIGILYLVIKAGLH